MVGSRLCLGTAQLGMDYGVANRTGRPSDQQCAALLQCAIDHRVWRWDTAPAYGDAEQRMGRFLSRHPARDRIGLVSKLAPVPKGLAVTDLAGWVTEQIETSLRRLSVDRLAAWLIHDPESLARCGQALWEAMLKQQQRGLVDRLGVSVYCPAEASQALQLPHLGALQLVLNLLDTRVVSEHVLERCRAAGVTVYARSPFLQGVFAFEPNQLPERIAELRAPLTRLRHRLGQEDWTPLQAALPFVLGHREIDFVVLGVDNVHQLEDNLGAAQREFPASLRQELVLLFSGLSENLLEPRHWNAT